jgi:hypothetical protein
MPTATIQVAAVTAPDQWTLGAGANKVVAVNGPDDDNASYIWATTAGLSEQYALSSHIIPLGSTINLVSTSRRIIRVGGGAAAVRLDLKLGGNTTTGTTVPATPTWATFTETMLRPGGGLWSPSDFASLEMLLVKVYSSQANCTSLWLIVDYTPPSAAGNMFLMFR